MDFYTVRASANPQRGPSRLRLLEGISEDLDMFSQSLPESFRIDRSKATPATGVRECLPIYLFVAYPDPCIFRIIANIPTGSRSVYCPIDTGSTSRYARGKRRAGASDGVRGLCACGRVSRDDHRCRCRHVLDPLSVAPFHSLYTSS